jgi:hypothetical protein
VGRRVVSRNHRFDGLPFSREGDLARGEALRYFTVPEPILTKVKLAEVFHRVPTDTARITHAQRQASLRSKLINARRVGSDA